MAHCYSNCIKSHGQTSAIPRPNPSYVFSPGATSQPLPTFDFPFFPQMVWKSKMWYFFTTPRPHKQPVYNCLGQSLTWVHTCRMAPLKSRPDLPHTRQGSRQEGAKCLPNLDWTLELGLNSTFSRGGRFLRRLHISVWSTEPGLRSNDVAALDLTGIAPVGGRFDKACFMVGLSLTFTKWFLGSSLTRH